MDVMRRGFVLAEALIAIGLFLSVVSIGVGGFARALRAIRQNASFVSASANTSLLLEQISREVRTGYDFCVNGQTCLLPNELSFKNAKGDTVTYRLSDSRVERTCDGECNGEPGTNALTPSNLIVRSVEFQVFGNAPGDLYQPRVTMSLGVSPREAGVESITTTIQSTVSSRLPLDS